jgi:succinyl-diaminopimelate desuccinylase
MPRYDNNVLQWLDTLLRKRSITPHDCGAQEAVCAMARSFQPMIELQHCPVGQTNNIAITLGPQGDQPHCHFIGHTDVVPAFEDAWQYPPFELTHVKGKLYGRGVCDMKGAIVAFLAAYQRCLESEPHKTVTLMLTSDEEGSGHDGLQHLLKNYDKRRVSFALIGEPTAQYHSGDRVKNARRGSLHGVLRLTGKSAHVAYPQKKDPLFFLKDLLQDLNTQDWDAGGGSECAYTSFQITKIHTQDCVENVIPAEIEIRFNFRYIPQTSLPSIQQAFQAILSRYPLAAQISWRAGAVPWQSSLDVSAIHHLFQDGGFEEPICCSLGGVSDGYKVAQYLTPKIIEIGLPHHTAHQEDEHVEMTDLKRLIELYHHILQTAHF